LTILCFIFPLLGIIFNVFHQVDCEGEVSAIALTGVLHLLMIKWMA